MITNILTAYKYDITVSYGKKDYRIQNDRGYKHIIVFECGKRKKITVSIIERDPVFDYIFEGGFLTAPCPAMDYWIMRWRNKVKISTNDYKNKYLA